MQIDFHRRLGFPLHSEIYLKSRRLLHWGKRLVGRFEQQTIDTPR